MILGDKIKFLRKKKGLTQSELATKLKTTKQTIGKYENGIVTNLPLNRIQELAIALDTTPAFLMGWDENQPTADGGSELKNSLNDLFDRLSPEEQKLVLAQIKGIIDNRK